VVAVGIIGGVAALVSVSAAAALLPEHVPRSQAELTVSLLAQC